MTSPDSNTALIVVSNIIGWFVAWWLGQRNGRHSEARKNIIFQQQHKMMWAEYKVQKEIKENGTEVT